MTENAESSRERLEREYTGDGMRIVLTDFFGVDAIAREKGKSDIKCRFDADAPDGSQEARWVIISPDKTPEQNMDILREARRRQAWYQSHRHEVPGIDVPQNRDEEINEAVTVLPAPGQ